MRYLHAIRDIPVNGPGEWGHSCPDLSPPLDDVPGEPVTLEYTDDRTPRHGPVVGPVGPLSFGETIFRRRRWPVGQGRAEGREFSWPTNHGTGGQATSGTRRLSREAAISCGRGHEPPG